MALNQVKQVLLLEDLSVFNVLMQAVALRGLTMDFPHLFIPSRQHLLGSLSPTGIGEMLISKILL